MTGGVALRGTVADGGRAWLVPLASPRLAVACFIAFAAAALGVSEGGMDATVVLPGPMLLFAVNLAAAIATHTRLRRDIWLLVFHLALLALVVLFAAARLTYFEATTSLTAGREFDNALENEVRGPLHPGRPETLVFRNEGFAERFAVADGYGATYNRVGWRNAAGDYQTAEIGDHVPLILDGYRIYTSRRGYAVQFLWEPEDGEAHFGSLQLQRHQEHAGRYDMAGDWRLPGGEEIWVTVDLPAPPARSAGVRENLGAGQVDHAVVVRVGSERHALRLGQAVDLTGGRLTYVRLGTWMGYRIIYDPTRPWLVGCVVVAVLSLLGFYGRIVFRRRTEREACA